MHEEMLHSLGLVARVDITTEDNRYVLQGIVLYDEVLEGMEFGFSLYEYYEGHYTKIEERTPLGYSFKKDRKDALQVCVKSLENWFETTLERVDFTTEVRMCEEGRL